MTIPFLSVFKKFIKSFSSKEAIFFWYRHYKLLFFFGFLIILSIGAQDWYGSLYKYQFSENEKKQYIDSYFKETVFKESKFRETVDDLTLRARMHEETLLLTRNIFEGKGIKPKE